MQTLFISIFLCLYSIASLSQISEDKYSTVTKDNAVVYPDEFAHGGKVDHLAKGTNIEIISYNGSNYFISYGNGKTGWIHKWTVPETAQLLETRYRLEIEYKKQKQLEIQLQKKKEKEQKIETLKSTWENSAKEISTKYSALLLDQPYGVDIYTIPAEQTIRGIPIDTDHYFVVLNDSVYGFVSKFFIEDKINDAARNEALEERKRKLIEKFGEENGRAVFVGKIWLGMTEQMARESKGKPNDIHRDIGSWGTKEQWIYNDSYLYFLNGKLTSWSER